MDIDAQSREAMYLQVARQLRRRILSGEWPVGTLVPSERTLTQIYDVSIETGRRAVALLRNEGLLETKKAIGTFVVRIPETARVRAAPGDEISARMPDPAERQSLALPEGVPVLVIRRPGQAEQVFDADLTTIEVAAG